MEVVGIYSLVDWERGVDYEGEVGVWGGGGRGRGGFLGGGGGGGGGGIS